MAISKLILDNTTQMDVTQDTVTAGSMLSGVTAHKNDGTIVTGNIVSKSESDVSVSNNIVTIPAGYYASQAQKTVGTAQAAQTITPGTTDQTIASGKYLTGTQTILGDANLVASNIASGVTIFGVSGTHEGGGGNDNLKDFIENYGIMTSFENSTVTQIGSYAFFSCVNLQTVSCPSCSIIYNNAFASCSKITEVSFPVCQIIGSNAFSRCTKLLNANFPLCTNVYYNAFYACTSITTASLPMCKSIDSYAFQYCYSLNTINAPQCTSVSDCAFESCAVTEISFPLCKTISKSAFLRCSSLSIVSVPSCTAIATTAFLGCVKLLSLYLNNVSKVTTLGGINAFTSTPIGGYTTSTGGVYGSIFVPISLVASFKTATNWVSFSARIVGI